MKVLVVGASGGSGRAAVERLLAAGHEVAAFSRGAEKLRGIDRKVEIISGDARDYGAVEAAVKGRDAVIVTLGITENPLRVRFFGAANTADNIRSAGTQNVIAAMKRHGVRKLVVQTTFGVGETKQQLPLIYRLMFSLLLKPQIADTETQEKVVRQSGLDWVLAQPVNLTDGLEEGEPFVSSAGETRGMKISRRKVGLFLVEASLSDTYVGRSVALSS